MSNPNQIHIVKGRIRAYNYCGVQEFLRQGALYFLPHEEFTIYDEIRMREFALCDDRISIRARDKSGLFRTRRIHIRFLENLRIETLANPSEKTIKYLDDHKIFYYQLDTRKYRHIQETLKHISEYKYEYPVSLKIDDELFKQACNFVADLQKTIAEDDLRKLHRLFFMDSVRIVFNKNKHIKTI